MNELGAVHEKRLSSLESADVVLVVATEVSTEWIHYVPHQRIERKHKYLSL